MSRLKVRELCITYNLIFQFCRSYGVIIFEFSAENNSKINITDDTEGRPHLTYWANVALKCHLKNKSCQILEKEMILSIV